MQAVLVDVVKVLRCDRTPALSNPAKAGEGEGQRTKPAYLKMLMALNKL